MIPLNFNHLYYFWTVARAGGISAATDRLCLTQSTLSLQLQKLERSLGKKLLVRHRRGASLTTEGKLVYDYCERMFIPAEGMAEKVRSATPPGPPLLKWGAAVDLPRVFTRAAVDFLRQSHFHNRAHLRTASWPDLQEELITRQVDVVLSGVDFSVTLGEDYRGKRVSRLPVRWVGTPRLAQRVKRFPADLARCPMLLRSPKSPLRKDVDHFLFKNRITASVEFETDDTDLLRDLCLDGRGVAALDSLTVSEALTTGRLVALNKTPLSMAQEIWLIIRRHHREEPALQAAIDCLMDRFSLPGPQLPLRKT